jgi:hypothetical protein
MANTSDLLTGASQLAALQAQRAGEGFSKDPGDYKLPWVKLSPPELNSADPKYKPELDPKGFSIGMSILPLEALRSSSWACCRATRRKTASESTAGKKSAASRSGNTNRR